jgi:hypothetical protein
MEADCQALAARLDSLTSCHVQLEQAHGEAQTRAEERAAALAAEQEALREAAAGLEAETAKARRCPFPSCSP